MNNLTVGLYVINTVLIWFFIEGVIALSILIKTAGPTIRIYIAHSTIGMVTKCKLPIAKIVDR